MMKRGVGFCFIGIMVAGTEVYLLFCYILSAKQRVRESGSTSEIVVYKMMYYAKRKKSDIL